MINFNMRKEERRNIVNVIGQLKRHSVAWTASLESAV